MKIPKLNYPSMLAKILVCIWIISSLTACSFSRSPNLGDIEVVSGLDFPPGDISISSSGGVFIAKQVFRESDGGANLIELTSKRTYLPFPNEEWNTVGVESLDRINAAQGIQADSQNRVWVIDRKNFSPTPTQSKLLTFDIGTKSLVFHYLLSPEVVRERSLLRHLAVDGNRGFAYISDTSFDGHPALIVVVSNGSSSWRYDGLKEFKPENIDLNVSGRVVTFKDNKGEYHPARLGLNAITLSADGNTLFFGPLNGLSWYSLPAKLLRDHSTITELASQVRRVGPKPICDGAATDSRGVHYFTNLGANSIDYLDTDGILKRLVSDKRLRWSGSIRVGPDGWLYVSTNQFDKSTILNEGKEEGVPPYLILKVYSGSPGILGK